MAVSAARERLGVSGHVVIDIDGEEGRESFVARPGPFPAAAASRTGREGYRFHLWRGTLVIAGGETGGRWLGGTDRQLRALLLSRFAARS